MILLHNSQINTPKHQLTKKEVGSGMIRLQLLRKNLVS